MGRTARERPKNANSTTAKNGRMPFADHLAPACTEALTTTAFGSAASGAAAAETARFIIHGSRGSYVKYGLDPQEERLKGGERLPQEDWGYDMRDGLLTRAEGEEITEESWLTLPANAPSCRLKP